MIPISLTITKVMFPTEALYKSRFSFVHIGTCIYFVYFFPGFLQLMTEIIITGLSVVVWSR